MARVERAERELSSKMEVINVFQANKRSEVGALNQEIEALSQNLKLTEMKCEEVWSKGAQVTAEYRKTFNTLKMTLELKKQAEESQRQISMLLHESKTEN